MAVKQEEANVSSLIGEKEAQIVSVSGDIANKEAAIKEYEDMIAQRISEDNFNRILENSQTEQATLKNRVMLNRERLAQQTQEQEDSTRWLEIIKDYADIQELDTVTLNRLVQKIVIHEDIDGETVRQTVEIHFNFNDKADKRRIIREK